MGVTMRRNKRNFYGVLGIVGLAVHGVAAAQSSNSTTHCDLSGRSVTCDTKRREADQPLDYGAILQQGQELVPAARPERPVPDRPYPQPLKESDRGEQFRTDYFLTGNGLLESCGEGALSRGWLACAAFIQGVSGTITGIAEVSGGRKMMCNSERATLGHKIDVVSKFLSDHPESRHHDAGPLAAVALIRAFPCDAK
ncbi:Rap1a/Tai family immunity protein [Novosphingobium sp.]|uniref:Rap1a/Tai family immunity protein n=1 Tax=Novosphingobium sp. TaxID=1874826 RepID=UPI0027344605|nr:Rap1a/Tai family immunity protein [Novosphingobium sp.]MDP3907044.1 Rap1a/Tai family immunity protein [Novosphingobium sp.]